MRLWNRVILNWVFFLALSGFFPQFFYVQNLWVALIASFVLALLDMLVKPILSLLSLPITFLTLGLFMLVINGVILEMTSWIVGSGFQFASFGAAMLIAAILSIVNSIATSFFQRN